MSVLITSIGYYGDQNDGEMENRSNTSEVVGDSVRLSGEEILCFFVLVVLCTR